MTSGSAIRTRQLSVRYGRRIALNQLDLTIGSGLTALLGPNGAGKSTLMSVLTASRPSSGNAFVAGFDLSNRADRRAASAHVGYLPQRFDLAESMRVSATVRYAAWCRGVSVRDADAAAQRALGVTELSGRSADRVRTLSGGERQRLGLACAIAHRPQVLLLDEPTVGLDPEQRIRFRGYISSLAEDRCVLLATHLLDDVRLLAARTVILSTGSAVFMGTPHDLQLRAIPDDDAAVDPLESGYRAVLRDGAEDRP